MTDEEMVAYLARCQLEPGDAAARRSRRSCTPSSRTRTSTTPTPTRSARSSVRPTASGSPGSASASTRSGCPYIRPGFALSKLVAEAVSANPDAKLVLLAKHGLVTWGATAAESYASTLEAINRAAAFVEEHGSGEPFGGVAPRAARGRGARALLAEVLPALRGALAVDGPRDPPGRRLARRCSSSSAAATRAELSQVGAACPDHLVHTKRRPVWVAFDPERDDEAALRERLVAAVHDYQQSGARVLRALPRRRRQRCATRARGWC